METDVLERLRARHAAKLDIPTDRVELVELDLDVLLKLGTLIDIDVRGLSSFTRRATWEELGVPEASARRARFTRGVKNLIPQEYIRAFRSLEVRARRWLNEHSFDVTGFRPYRYVPFTAYPSWREGHERLVRQWEMLKLKVLFEYRFLLVPELEEDFEEVAVEAARALRLRGQKRQEFIAHVIERAKAAMPTYRALCESLVLDYRAGLLLSRARIEEELAVAAEMEAKRREALARARAAEAEAAHKERLLEEMRKAELEHYKEQLRQMASPIAEVFHQLRAQMYEDAVAVLTTMQKNNGKLIGPAVRRARSMVKTFRLLNALDDKELEKLLDAIERQLEAGPSERRAAQVEETLHQIARLTHRSAAEVRRLTAPSRWQALRL